MLIVRLIQYLYTTYSIGKAKHQAHMCWGRYQCEESRVGFEARFSRQS